VPYLKLLSDDKDGMTQIPILTGRPFTIGRGAASSFRVRDPKLSRVHCEISVSGGIAIITDLGSMNGTYVNGKRIASTALQDQDVIQAGYTKLQYHAAELEAAPEAPPPEPAEAEAEPAGPTLTAVEPDPPAPPETPAAPAAPEPEPTATQPPQAPTAEKTRPSEPPGRDDRAVAEALRITRDEPTRPLRKNEKMCSSCRRPIPAKALKSGAATDIHGQACCPECIASDPLIGRTIAGCRIDAKLGAGAWSATYKAEQLSMARPVVFRVLQSDIAGDPELVALFLAAVKRSGQISHPNLVRIYDIGRTDDFCYVTSELVDGSSLQGLLGAKPAFDPPRAVDLILQVTGAVDAAHRRGVFHRDIRPSNVVLNDDGIAKLIGLGFAKSLEDAAAAGSVAIRHVADSVLYWPPECVVEPTHAVPQTDIYSLGAVLYAVLAGRPAFETSDTEKMVRRVRRLRPKPLHSLRDDVPHRLSAVVAKAMAKSPADRYADCRAFLAALRSALDEPRRPGGRRR
jgi:serine/threonine-protein kinase